MWLWDAELAPRATWSIAEHLTAGERVAAVAFQPDGVSLLALTSGEATLRLHLLDRRGGWHRALTLPAFGRPFVLEPADRLPVTLVATGDHLLILDRNASTLARDLEVCRGGTLRALAPFEPLSKVFALCDTTITEVDLGLGRRTRTAQAPCRLAGGGLSATGTLLYVGCFGAARVYALDRVTLAARDSFELGAPIEEMLVLAPGREALVLHGEAAAARIDLRSGTASPFSLPGRVRTLQALPAGAVVVAFPREGETGISLLDRRGRERALGAVAEIAALAAWPQATPRFRWEASPATQPPQP